MRRGIGFLASLVLILSVFLLFPQPAFAQWSGWASEGGLLTSNIAVARNGDGRLEVFVRGTDSALWHKWQVAPNDGWSGWASEGGVLTSDPVLAQNSDGRLEIFVRGTDGALWHKWQVAPNDGWSAWASEGGVLTSQIAVGRNSDGRLEVFVRGTDGALWHKWQVAPNSGWSGWASLGGVITSDPTVAQNADGRLEVFARGTDLAVWHIWQVAPNNGWSGWASLGGVITSDPTVAQNADGRLEILARGTDMALWHIWQTAPSNGWSGWASEGGVLSSNIAVARNADGRLEAFVQGTDGALWHKWQVAPNDGWSGWASLGGIITTEAAAAQNADGRLEVFARGTDMALWHNWQTSASGISVVDMIPASLSAETNQDSEPFLAVHPTNPELMAASAFTPNPAGASSSTAPVFISQDGGNLWLLNNVVLSAGMTSDITHASTGRNSTLYAGILRRPGGLLLNEQFTSNFLSSATMTAQSSRGNVDQPFVQVAVAGSNDRIYVGNNDFNALPRSATVDVSLNGGSAWNSVRIECRNTSGQDGPSIRPTVARDNTVYAAFFGWRSFSGGIATSDVVVVRDDNGATGANPFRNLTDPGDGLCGRRVVQGVTIPWVNGPALGQQRIGSNLTIAADPNNSATVYISWADRVGNGDIYTIHVRRSTDRGQTWSNDLRTLTDATNPALAVASNGTVGLLYQQVSNNRWVTHLEQTRNAFTNVRDTILSTVPTNTPAPQFQPYLGDYDFLLAVGGEFRGIFSANNTPDLGNFPQGVKYQRRANFTTKQLLNASGGVVAISIDPFYFTVPVMR